MIIFAFGHKSRVGKDTACTFLQTHLRMTYSGVSICKVAFADSLKLLAYDLYAYAGVQYPSNYDKDPSLREQKLPSLGMTVVELWVKLGNDLRAIHPDVWAERVLSVHNDCDILLISDLRYANEASLIRAKGPACLIKITRDNAIIRNTVADNALNDWLGWNHEIKNNGTMGEYHKTITQIADNFIDKHSVKI